MTKTAPSCPCSLCESWWGADGLGGDEGTCSHCKLLPRVFLKASDSGYGRAGESCGGEGAGCAGLPPGVQVWLLWREFYLEFGCAWLTVCPFTELYARVLCLHLPAPGTHGLCGKCTVVPEVPDPQDVLQTAWTPCLDLTGTERWQQEKSTRQIPRISPAIRSKSELIPSHSPFLHGHRSPLVLA